MIYPTLEQFKDLRRENKVVAISKHITGDMETPITLFKKLKNREQTYLLESVETEDRRGRYSFIGRNPFITIKAYGNKVYVTKEDKTYIEEGSPLQIVKNIMENYKAPYIENLPDFTGGAVGYIGYDIAKNYKNINKTKDDDIKLPDLHFILTKQVIVYDHVKQKVIIIVNILKETEDDKKGYEKAIEKIKQIEKEILTKEIQIQKRENGQLNIKYSSNETKNSFIEKVNKTKQYIKKGEVSQVVLSQRLQLETELDPLEVYRNLRSINPSPYLFYIDFKNYQVIGSSPELMVKVKGDNVETCPIAGTRPRGKTLKEDEYFEQDLLRDKKEVAEHLMLLDLAKADIKSISKNETVKVSNFMEICKCSHVMHIKSTVIGKLKENYNMYDALITCLPAGTLSGFPKGRAMEIIEELENRKRGIYGGAIGYFGFNGNMDTCIAIRFILFKDKKAYLQAGAGIVKDSKPEKEYEETERKLAALMQTIEVSQSYKNCIAY